MARLVYGLSFAAALVAMACNPGTPNDLSTQRQYCEGSYCGDGILDVGEECDDGNYVDGDGCQGNCTLTRSYCGDGILDAGEECDDGNYLDGDGCQGNCTIKPPAGGEGCTPGYWKQEQHFDSWTAPYAPATLFSAVFEDAFPGLTLLQVLSLQGGGLNALGRHTVAALLNGASGGVSYDLAAAQVIAEFNALYPSADKDSYEALKNTFATFNEQGCPLN